MSNPATSVTIAAVKALDLFRDFLERNGATEFKLLTDLSGGPKHWTFGRQATALATGDHHMGGLRMSALPDEGIVDPNCRFHGIDNFYAAGCAVFPTSGYANPTLTIVALALRLADHLVCVPDLHTMIDRVKTGGGQGDHVLTGRRSALGDTPDFMQS